MVIMVGSMILYYHFKLFNLCDGSLATARNFSNDHENDA